MKQWLACALGLALVACGGGGGGSEDGGPAPLPDSVVKAASLAELQAYSMPAAQKAELRWTDWVEGETGFRVDKSVNNSWTPVATLPSTPGGALAGVPSTWTGPLEASPTSYRVVAVLADGREIALKALSGAAELKLGVPTEMAATAIALDQPEPVRGNVKLSVAGAPAGAVSARFSTNQLSSQIGPLSTAGPRFETSWSAGTEAEGDYKVKLQLQYAPGTFVEIERVVAVRNQDLSATFVSSIGNDTPRVTVYVIPSSRSGAPVVSASLSVDGKAVGTLDKTACHVVAVGSACVQAFLFEFLSLDLDVGPHVLQVALVDANGLRGLVTGSMVKPAPLTVTLTSPLQSRFTAGKVEVRGELTGDPSYSGTLKLLLRYPDLSERLLLERSGYGPFSLDVDMTGLPDGRYSLSATGFPTVKAGGIATASAAVLWQAQPPMAYERIKDLPFNGSLTASGAGGVLLNNNFTAEWVIPGGTPAGAVLPTAVSTSEGQWKFAGDRWLARAVGSGTIVYAWRADGSRQAISNGDAGAFSAVGTQAGWLQDVGGQPTLWLSNLAAPAPAAVPLSGNATTVQQNEGAGLSLGMGASGKVVAAYAAVQRSVVDGVKASAVYVYDEATHAHRRVSAEDSIASAPLTDGRWVAWGVAQRANTTPGELWVAPVDGSSPPTRLSSSLAGAAQWADGLLVWSEPLGGRVFALKAWRNGVTTTLRTELGAVVLAVGSGAVAYAVGSRLYVWTPGKGERLVHSVGDFDAAALTEGWIYFTVGYPTTLYRAQL